MEIKFKKEDQPQNPTGGVTRGPLPDGKYEVIIGETKLGESSLKKTPYIEAVLTVRDDIDEQKPHKGRKVWQKIWFTEKTVGIINRWLQAAGAMDGDEFEGREHVAGFLKGKAVKVNVGSYTGTNGKEYNEVKWVEESNIAPPRPQAEETSIDISDDDLPF
jgi:S-adenosylhomocysteine hydrolase